MEFIIITKNTLEVKCNYTEMIGNNIMPLIEWSNKTIKLVLSLLQQFKMYLSCYTGKSLSSNKRDNNRKKNDWNKIIIIENQMKKE